MYLGDKKASLKAVDNGISAAVPDKSEDMNLFVPVSWAKEEAEVAPAEAVDAHAVQAEVSELVEAEAAEKVAV